MVISILLTVSIDIMKRKEVTGMIKCNICKRTILMFIALIIMCIPMHCFATEVESYVNDGVTLRYAVNVKINPQLSISGNSAKPKVTLTANAGDVDTAEIRIVLEKKSGTSYSVVKTWRDQTVKFNSTGNASWSNSYALTESGTYRIRVSGTAYENGKAVFTFTDNVSRTAIY